MSIVAEIDKSAIRRRLSHDIRASLFNIDGFLDELRASIVTIERLLDQHRQTLPQDFTMSANEIIRDDTRTCLDCLESAALQLQERIDLLTMSSEAGVTPESL